MTDPNLVRWPLRLLSKGTFITIFTLFLLNPAPLIGDSAQAQALKDYHLSKIRSALDLQEIQMSDDTLAQLTRSIADESEKHSLEPMLLMAIIEVESRFDQKAVSPQGALGLMQVQPIVVAALVEEGKISPADKNRKLNLKDPVVNVKVGASYLAHLKDLFGDLKIALTAYNAGPTWVSKMIAAKQMLPLQYATKVLSTQRSLENRFARQGILSTEASG
jgi:soluble lytic murein transglycosylase-like protein